MVIGIVYILHWILINSVSPSECIEPLREGGDRQGDSLEYFDDKSWLHTINGSCWKDVDDQRGKDNQVKKFRSNA